MKTCPNCKTTGLPDDAKFCPICGYVLQDISNNTWQEQYEKIREYLEASQNEKQQWYKFNDERQKMLSVLKQSTDFEFAMKENIDIIRYNRVVVRKKIVWSRVIRWSLSTLLCVADVVVVFHPIIFGLWIFPSLWVFLAIFFFLSFLPSCLLSWEPVEEKSLIDNCYTKNFYEPFIKNHKSNYERIIAKPVNENEILEIEIYEPETITKSINQRIEKLNKMIEDFEQQIELIKEIK